MKTFCQLKPGDKVLVQQHAGFFAPMPVKVTCYHEHCGVLELGDGMSVKAGPCDTIAHAAFGAGYTILIPENVETDVDGEIWEMDLKHSKKK